MAKKLDCSEVALTIFKIAMHHASTPGVTTIDEVTSLMQRSIPEVDRRQIVQSIVEVSEAKAKQVTEVQKQLYKVKQEARNDTRLTGAITELQKAIDENTLPAKMEKKPPARPKAIQQLMDRRDALKGELKKTDAAVSESVKREQKSVENRVQSQINKLQKFLDTNTAPEASSPAEGPKSQRVTELTEQRDALKEKLKNSHAVVQKEHTAARKAEEKKLETRITELQTLIDENRAPEPKAAKQGPKTEKITRARDRIEELKKELSESHAVVQQKHKKANEKRVQNLEVSLKKVEDALAAGTTVPKTGAKQGPNIEAVQNLIDKRAAALEAVRNSPAAFRERYEAQIAEMTQRIVDNNFVPPVSRDAAPNTPEVNRAMMERDRLRNQINRRIENLKPLGFWGNVGKGLNVARSLMTSIDLSAVGRQGNFLVLSRPGIAAKAIMPMLKSFASEQHAYDINKEIMDDEMTPLFIRAGGFLSDPNNGVAGMEENWMSRGQEIVEKIPGIAGSQRAYTTFLNKARMDLFKTLSSSVAVNGEPTMEEAQALATFVNAATGRGTLGQFEKAAEMLNTVFWSPRYVTSRFQLATGSSLRTGPASVRKAVAKEYGRFALGLVAVLSATELAGWLYGARDGEYGIEKDPRSGVFGKLKLGNTTVDPFGGLGQAAALVARAISGQTKTKGGEIKSIRGDTGYAGQDFADYGQRFLRGKLAPGPATALDLLSGSNVNGEIVTPTSAGLSLVTPMSLRDMHGTMTEEGVPAGLALTALSLLGFSTQTYPDKPKKR